MSPHRLLVALGLLAVLVLLLGRSLLPGYALTPSDLVFGSPFYADMKPSGFKQASNSLLFDQAYQFVPWRKLAWDSLRQGRLPLWNPYSYSGTPFIATLQSAVFYPLNLLLNLSLPYAMTFAWSALLRLWLAGLATHALALEYGLRRTPAILAGLSFMLCAFLVTWLGHPHINVLALLPLAVLLSERLIVADRRRQLAARSVGLGLVLGCAMLGGHPASLVSLMLTVLLYVGIRQVQRRRERLPGRWTWSLPALAGAVFLAVVISAVQTLPFLEWLPLSNELSSRSAVPFRMIDASAVWRLLTLPLAVMPNLLNNPSWSQYPYWSFLARRDNYNEYALYTGVITVLAALTGLAHYRWRPLPAPLIAWVVIGLVGLGRHLHLPVVGWINHLPIIGLGDSGRSQVTYMLAIALVGAWGMDLMLGDDSVGRQVRSRFGQLASAVAVLGAGIMLGANLVLPAVRAKVVAFGRAQVDREYALRATHTHPILYYYDEVDRMVAGLVAAYRPSNIAMYSSAGIALLAWGATAIQRRRPGLVSGKHYSGVLLGLAAADMLLFARGYNPVIATQDLYPESPVVTALRHDHTLYRITALRQDLVPDAHVMHRFSDVRGLDYPTRWYREYMGLVPDRLPWLTYGEILSSANSPLLRVLNLKYIMSARRSDLDRLDNVARITQYGSIHVAELDNPTPRAFLSRQAVLLPSDSAVLQRLRAQPERVYDRIVLRDGQDERNAVAQLPSAIQSVAPASDTVTNVVYEAERSVWRVHATVPSILFLSDAYYPGWQATIDDAPSPILRANHAFRAVVVPSGDHTISFEYAPASLARGLRLSLAGWAIALVTLLLLVATRSAAAPHSAPHP